MLIKTMLCLHGESMNQKEAVYEAIKSLKPDEVDKDKPVKLTKQEKGVVQSKLFEGFRKGKIQYMGQEGALPSDDYLLTYISGLVSNWLRKDKRLNRNTNYVPQRPGSRTGIAPQPASTVTVPGSVPLEQLQAIQALAGDDEEVEVFVVRRRRPQSETSAPEAPSTTIKRNAV